MAKERTLWGIHAGKTGDAETLSERHNVVVIGWEEVGDRAQVKVRDEQR